MSREMKNSDIPWIGEIPDGWEVCEGKRLYLSNDGGVWGDDPTGENDTIVLRSTEQTIDGKLLIKSPALRHLSTSEKSFAILKKGDLIITKSSGSISHIGKTSIINEDIEQLGCCYSNFLQRLRISGIANYFWYVFNSVIVKSQFDYISTTTTGINNINSKMLDTLLLTSPPLPEQQKIADYLDKVCGEIDGLVALQEAMIDELKAYKQSVITEAVTRGLNPNVPLKPSGIDWIGDIPEHWRVNKVFRLFERIGSGTTPSSFEDDAFQGSINWIQSGDLNGGILRESKNKISQETLARYSALSVYKAPFIIVAMYGASVGNISISEIDGCVNQACCVLCEPLVDNTFAFYSIMAAQRYLIYRAVGGGQPNISQNTLKQLWIVEPPLSEQQQIASFLDTKCAEIDALVTIKQQKIGELKEYKKSVIYEYVTGKKEVV